MTKKTFKVKGMHCTSCAMVIESDLEDAGIKSTCNYAKETLAVEYDDTVTKDALVYRIVKESGYDIVAS